MGNQNRDKSIDVLRAIALTGLIIIHISPSIGWIREIRNFDVPLMVFLSGVSYALSTGGANIIISSYVYKRFQRLILPTWIFLLLYHSVVIIVSLVSTHSVNWIGISKTAIVNFTFMTGWYIWIMRLFFIVALFAPLLSKFTKSSKLIHLYLFVTVVLLLNEFLVLWIGEDCPTSDWRVILEMNIPYFVVFCIGTFISKMSKKNITTMMFCTIIVFIAIALCIKNDTGAFQSLQTYKYPPQAYYMTYGISVALLLWLIRDKIVAIFEKMKILNVVEFIGSHTMWIYFWHIFLLVYIADFISIATVRFLVVYVFACLFTYLQSIVINKIALRCEKESTKKKLLMLFNG